MAATGLGDAPEVGGYTHKTLREVRCEFMYLLCYIFVVLPAINGGGKD